jgi:hypothetical protein
MESCVAFAAPAIMRRATPAAVSVVFKGLFLSLVMSASGLALRLWVPSPLPGRPFPRQFSKRSRERAARARIWIRRA